MTRDRRWLRVAAVFAIVTLSGPPADATPGVGLAGTAHDFTDESSEAVGLCTFCHTPHRAQQTRLLWNHQLSSQSYSWSDTTVTTGGTLLPSFDATWQGISKNCLSCHDGTVAIGDVAWFRAQANPALFADRHSDPSDPFLITFNNGPGGDLAGNHPVAHPFPYQGVASTYNGVTTGAPAVGSGWQPDPESLGVRLFNDDGAGNVSAGAMVGKTGIECSSCHDPHNGNQVVGDFFLRGTLTGNDTSYICLKCHAK